MLRGSGIPCVTSSGGSRDHVYGVQRRNSLREMRIPHLLIGSIGDKSLLDAVNMVPTTMHQV